MRSLLRLFELLVEITRFSFWVAVDRVWWPHSGAPSAQRLCLSLARLGTTFVKLGQALSLRQELLPAAYITALESLQDHVAPFPSAIAFEEIERAFGKPIDTVFSDIDASPLAAGSIAQVYAARLMDGQEVIVKVRRPNLEHQIDIDMRALSWLMRIAATLAPRLRRWAPMQIIDEIWSNLRKEIDFRREGRNIRRFSELFSDWPAIHIPNAIDGLISECVIVQQRSSGHKVDDPEVRHIGQKIAKTFSDAYLYQIFVLGLFHGDPHPGNIFITADHRICFHDFGLVGTLDRATRRRLAVLAVAFINEDPDWLLDAAIDLGIINTAADSAYLRHGVSEIISDYASVPMREWSLAEAFRRIARLGRGCGMAVPYDLIVLMRALFLAEHAIRTLDPEFEIIKTLISSGEDALKCAIERSEWTGALGRGKIELLAALSEVPAVVGSIIRQFHKSGALPGALPSGLEIKELEERFDRSSNRVVLGLVTLGLYVGGSLLMQHSFGPRLFGDFPILAGFAYGLALWFTIRLALGISRSGKL
jgi:ubiquinone biosynthesis protein